MSDELLKLDDDLYCLWNNTVDAPSAWGSRTEIFDLMRDKHHVCKVCGHSDLQDRFDRADDSGCSALWRTTPPTGVIYMQRGWLPWERIAAFLASFDEDAQEFDLALLDPFDDAEVPA